MIRLGDRVAILWHGLPPRALCEYGTVEEFEHSCTGTLAIVAWRDRIGTPRREWVELARLERVL